MASQRHKLTVHNYGATCYTFDEKTAAAGYIRQQPGPYVQPVGPAGGPLKGSTLSGPPPASLPGPLEQLEHPLAVLGLVLAAGQKPPEPPDPDLVPAADRLVPPEAVIGDPDFTMSVQGVRFVDGAVIVFNGGDEPAEFVSDTEVTTIVKPSTASTPGVYTVAVRNPDGQVSNELGFEFLEEAPVARKTKTKGKK